MNSSFGKKKLFLVLVPIFVALLLLNLFAFLVPIQKCNLTSHFIVYGCATFMLVVEAILLVFLTRKEESLSHRVLLLPTLYSTIASFAIEVVLTALLFLLNGFFELPEWVVIVLEALSFSYLFLIVAKGLLYKEHAETVMNKKSETLFMDELTAKLRVLYETNRDCPVTKELENLWDLARGSDPISSGTTEECEGKLNEFLQDLEQKISHGSFDEAKDVIRSMSNALLKRRSLCKLGK